MLTVKCSFDKIMSNKVVDASITSPPSSGTHSNVDVLIPERNTDNLLSTCQTYWTPKAKVFYQPDDAEDHIIDIEVSPHTALSFYNKIYVRFEFSDEVRKYYEVENDNFLAGALQEAIKYDDSSWRDFSVGECTDYNPLTYILNNPSPLDSKHLTIFRGPDFQVGYPYGLRFYCVLTSKEFSPPEPSSPDSSYLPKRLLFITPDPIIKVGRTNNGTGANGNNNTGSTQGSTDDMNLIGKPFNVRV